MKILHNLPADFLDPYISRYMTGLNDIWGFNPKPVCTAISSQTIRRLIYAFSNQWLSQEYSFSRGEGGAID